MITGTMCVAAFIFSSAQPGTPAEGTKSESEQRAYLPVVLKKLMAENEHEHAKALAGLVQLFEALEDMGDIPASLVDEARGEVLRGQIKIVQRDADYLDALDPFQLQFPLPPERLRKLEQAAILPLARHLRQSEELFNEPEVVRKKVIDKTEPDDARRIRDHLRRILMESKLVKDTPLAKPITLLWAEWEMQKDPSGLLRKHRLERRDLLAREADKGGRPRGGSPRLLELDLVIDLGELEQALRLYEQQPWKLEKDRKATNSHLVLTDELLRAVANVLYHALTDRLAAHQKSRPALAPIQLEGVDLLDDEVEKAEQAVTSALKKPERAIAGKRLLRKVRVLAATYRVQHRLYELAQTRVRSAMEESLAPPDRKALPHAGAGAALGKQVLDAYQARLQAKNDLCETWVAYQIARFDLFRELGKTPP